MPSKGIIMAALGHPYYAHMAKNLAVSILFHNPEMKIALIHDNVGFNLLYPEDKAMFSHTIEVKAEDYQNDVYRFKLDLDKLTPFDETMFLDVDMIWLQNTSTTPEHLMNELSGVDFTMISRGKISTDDSTMSKWVDLKEVASQYKVDSVYDISSELMFWTKGTKVFEEARKVYKNPKVTVSKFGSGLPDEAFFMIALAKKGIQLHKDKWEPTYWEPRYYPRQNNREFIGGFYAMSVGGAFVSNNIKKYYNILNNHYHYSLGIGSSPYQLQEKSRIFKERRYI